MEKNKFVYKQSRGFQRVTHDLVTQQQQAIQAKVLFFK